MTPSPSGLDIRRLRDDLNISAGKLAHAMWANKKHLLRVETEAEPLTAEFAARAQQAFMRIHEHRSRAIQKAFHPEETDDG